ncbi:MAG: alkaline phosphatase family protein [Pyrinomonadaceae bacterium]
MTTKHSSANKSITNSNDSKQEPKVEAVPESDLEAVPESDLEAVPESDLKEHPSEHGGGHDAGERLATFPRRTFLAGVAATTGVLALGSNRVPAQTVSTLPDPAASGIEHVVVVMMENRSFDHFLGWLPNADGKQAGLSYKDRTGLGHPTYPLAPDYQGCAHPDPDHSYEGGRVEYNGGACDGWLRAGNNDTYAIGYYIQNDLSFFGRELPHWTTFDRYFSAIMAETYPNRFYQHAAQTDRLHNSFTISKLPTIWDRLAERGLTGLYYYSDVPFLALWGRKYIPISRPFGQFLADCATNNLPHVSFVEPRFIGAGNGTSNDDHPHADIRNGQFFLELVYKAVTLSPGWSKTVLVYNYDEWGGFFDHVAPPTAPIPPADQAAGNADGLLGFRVPSLLVAPWARSGYVSDTTYDHTSILKMIEWRWDLEPLTVRDQSANNLAEALDFTLRRRFAPQFFVPPGPFGVVCPPSIPAVSDEWSALKALAAGYGWPV